MAMMKLSVLLGALLLGGQVSAHELTRAETGREVVSQCFTQCTLEVSDLQAAHADVYFSLTGQFLDLLGRALRGGYDISAEADEFLEVARHARCSLAQREMNVADLCQSGCRDLEQVYGSVRSHARTRFYYHFYGAKTRFEEAGLWTDYRNWPREDEDEYEFERACDRYLQ